MTYLRNRRESGIFKALKEYASSTEQIGGGCWSLALANGKSLTVTARLSDEWLFLDSPLSDRVERRGMWDLLRMNASLDGLSKLVLMPDNRSVHLRAELPLLDEPDFESDHEEGFDGELTARVHGACAALKRAFRRFQGESKPDSAESIDVKAQAEIGSEELHRLFVDVGWPFTERSAGKFAVELDVRNGFYQATVEQREAGAHVSVEVARAEALAGPSRQALSLLLLKAGGRVWMARPAVEEAEQQITARFEVRFGAMPTVPELRHALSSLSVACTMCEREASAIKDEIVAREYLTVLSDKLQFVVTG